MLTIIRQRLKDQFRSVAIYIAALVAYALLMISLFPTLQKMDIQALMANYPKKIADFFSSSGMTSYNTIEGYMSMEYLGFFFILIVVFYIGSVAASAIAGQIERRTMDFNLSQPISRTEIVVGESIVAVFYSLVIVFSTSLAMFVFGKAFNAPFQVKGLVAFLVIATLFILALYGIAIFLSSILKTKMSVTLLTFGLTLGFYVFTSLTRIVDKLKSWEKISIFHLYNPEQLLKTGSIDWSQAGTLFLIFLVGLLASVLIFNKKDV